MRLAQRKRSATLGVFLRAVNLLKWRDERRLVPLSWDTTERVPPTALGVDRWALPPYRRNNMPILRIACRAVAKSVGGSILAAVLALASARGQSPAEQK